MAVETTEMSLLMGMDSLWFYHAILFSNNSLFIFPKLSLPTSESSDCSSKSCSQISVISEQEISPLASIKTGSRAQTSSQECDHDKTYTKHENRPTRLNLVSSKTRYHHSSSPLTSARRKSRKSGHGHCLAMRLQKTMSCKSLGELELEEVKGFTDLGFNFKKEKLSTHLMRLIPGLQRIDNTDNDEDDEDDNGDEGKKGAMRPYLSEAWFVKMADDNYSPLMSLRVERVSSNEDMKKHLKCWARIVALAIQQQGS